MEFVDTQKELFEKNIKACSNKILVENLKKLKNTSRFKLVMGKDPLDINIQDTKDNDFIYTNPIKELEDMLNLYQKKYPLYPVLYFYGFGNGILYKALLQNPNLQFCIVFEKEIELIYLMFHNVDFSNELKNTRLMLIQDKNLNASVCYNHFCSEPFNKLFKTYFLELHSNYYEKFVKSISKLHKILISTQKQIAIESGNDPLDALQGLEQQVHNLPAQLTHITGKELLTKRGGQKGKTAVIVSTGPSLSKQLPLLKQYQDKIAIFSADSSFPILARNGIKPDYVCMLERTDFTAEFFNHDFKDIDKETLFVLLNVVHPNAVSYCEQHKRQYMITPKHLPFSRYLDFRQFTSMSGMSVAHVCLDLAVSLGYSNVIFIGQDLAYADDGSSHPKDYQHSANFESGMYDDSLFMIKAYGGKKQVQSHLIWVAFRDILERRIFNYKKYYGSRVKFYNCTEGGARIQGTIETPFKTACERFLKNKKDKVFDKLEKPSEKQQIEYLFKAYAKIQKSIVLCQGLIEEFKESLKSIIEKSKQCLSNQDYKQNEAVFRELMEEVDKAKEKIEDPKKAFSAYEILHPFLKQADIANAPLFVLNPQNDEEKQDKLVKWIERHIAWIRLVGSHLEAHIRALQTNSKPLVDLLNLKDEKIQKKIKMIDKKAKEGKCMMFS